jgi:hypothetical protein
MNAMSQEELDLLNQFREDEMQKGWEDFRLEALANRGLLLRGEEIDMNQVFRIKCEGGILVVNTLVLVDLNKRLRAKCAASQSYTISAQGIRARENPTISKFYS